MQIGAWRIRPSTARVESSRTSASLIAYAPFRGRLTRPPCRVPAGKPSVRRGEGRRMEVVMIESRAGIGAACDFRIGELDPVATTPSQRMKAVTPCRGAMSSTETSADHRNVAAEAEERIPAKPMAATPSRSRRITVPFPPNPTQTGKRSELLRQRHQHRHCAMRRRCRLPPLRKWTKQ